MFDTRALNTWMVEWIVCVCAILWATKLLPQAIEHLKFDKHWMYLLKERKTKHCRLFHQWDFCCDAIILHLHFVNCGTKEKKRKKMRAYESGKKILHRNEWRRFQSNKGITSRLHNRLTHLNKHPLTIAKKPFALKAFISVDSIKIELELLTLKSIFPSIIIPHARYLKFNFPFSSCYANSKNDNSKVFDYNRAINSSHRFLWNKKCFCVAIIKYMHACMTKPKFTQ